MKSLQQFFGMVNFYGKLLSLFYRCASIIQIITNLLTNVKKCNIVVLDDALTVFSNIKATLAITTKLSYVPPDAVFGS